MDAGQYDVLRHRANALFDAQISCGWPTLPSARISVTLVKGAQRGAQTLRCDVGLTGDLVGQRARVIDQPCDVNRVRCGPVDLGKANGRAAKDGERTLGIATLDVGDADRELG